MLKDQLCSHHNRTTGVSKLLFLPQPISGIRQVMDEKGPACKIEMFFLKCRSFCVKNIELPAGYSRTIPGSEVSKQGSLQITTGVRGSCTPVLDEKRYCLDPAWKHYTDTELGLASVSAGL